MHHEHGENCSHGSKCGCPCHSAKGIFITLVGVVFLLKAMGIISDDIAGYIWPSVIILIGLKMTFKNVCKCCSKK
ncbi:DUF5668 domain-containing protein [bacterium]|nr:DUF5668 domain-containing protein [bacterium]